MQSELNYQVLDKELDKVKTKVFLTKNAGFLGPLLCSVNFLWTEDIKTAQTNGISLYWNPHWFMKLPFDTRVTVLLHELWHIFEPELFIFSLSFHITYGNEWSI